MRCSSRGDGWRRSLGSPCHLMHSSLRYASHEFMLVVPLVVAGYAGLTGLILPLVALRSVFPRRGRRQRLVDLQSLAAERLLPAHSEPLPATAETTPQAPSL